MYMHISCSSLNICLLSIGHCLGPLYTLTIACVRRVCVCVKMMTSEVCENIFVESADIDTCSPVGEYISL